MKIPFRDHHCLQLLHEYEQKNLPLDVFMSDYFRAHKSLGSKDRAIIGEAIYQMIRWQKLLDYLIPEPPSWKKRLEVVTGFCPKKYQNDEKIPLATRLSFPEFLFDLIVSSHGLEKGSQICFASNFPAPTTIRANSLKITRDQLLDRLNVLGYEIKPCLQSPHGIQFEKRTPLFSLDEFSKGFFEIQDEGSQLIANLMKAKPGQKVLDWCAGSGGKTLAFAPDMQNKGQIFLHDIRPWALMAAQRRLRRAGIQNAQVIQSEDSEKLKKLKKKMDLVFVDAPCSGTGTVRRNPDSKWKFQKEIFEKLLGQQRAIFEKALSFLAPDGHIVYATCSLLKEENEQQVEHFLNTYNLQLIGSPFVSLPKEKEMDGFYGVTLKRK